MRDWLPAEAAALSVLARRVLGSCEEFGYQRVTVPAFEYAEVLERGLGALDPTEVLRFVEPETGEIVALRPDMTPQIARLTASRLGDRPLPARIAYEGSVVRLRRERARRRRQIPQAGAELIGAHAPEGDREVLEVCVASVRSAGLSDFVLDLSHARVAGALLEEAAPQVRTGLIEALSVRDPALVRQRASRASLSHATARALGNLVDLAGGPEVLSRAEQLLASTAAAAGVRSLRSMVDWVAEQGLAPRLFVDCADVRHLAYYTGTLFQILAEGPGEPVASGGRYDNLLARFGPAWPAAGFAVDLDNLAWAVGSDARAATEGVVLSGAAADELAKLAAGLRERGVRAVCSESGEAYARGWGFTHHVHLGGADRVIALATGHVVSLSGGSSAERAERIAAVLKQSRGGVGDGE